MLTIPANLQIYLDRDFSEPDFLLKITGATTTFRLSGHSRTITESGTDYLYRGLVKSWGTIKNTIDPSKSKLNIGNMVITLINIPYKFDSPSRLSEQFTATEISYREASVYLWAGGISDLSDCLQIYKGVIRPIENIGGARFEIELNDATETKHKLLPENLIVLSDYTNPPAASENKPIPLAYGDFNPAKDYNNIKYGKLIEGIWIEPNKLVFSDHVLKAIDAVWILDEDLGELVKVDSGDYTETLDDSGRSTVVFDNVVDALLEAWIYPDKADVEHIDSPDYVFLDEEKDLTLDRDGNTFALADADSYVPNGESDDEHEDRIYGRFKSVSPIGDHQTVYLSLRFDINFNTILQQGNDFSFWIDNSSTEVGHLPLVPGDLSLPYYDEVDITTAFNTSNLTLQDIVAPNGLRLQVIGRKRSGDGNRKKIGEYYDMRLRVKYKRSIQSSMRVFIEGEGRKYGSWIDGGGRSNSYDEGDLISNPAFIIEDILRELGFATADIDEDSFDTVGEALSTNWDIVIFLNKQVDSKVLIEQICGEAGLGFFLTADGKGKIFRLPDIARADDFDLANIKKQTLSFSMGEERFLVNDVDIEYIKSNHIDELYHLVSVGNNSASQTKHNIKSRKTIKADFIESTSVADRLRDQYIGAVLLGDNGIGGTVNSEAYETKVGCKFTAADSRRLFWIAAYLGSDGASREFYAAVYADSSGAPAAQLATTSVKVIGPSSSDGPAWVFFAFDGLDLTSGTDYWLAIKGVGGTWKFYYDSGGTNQAAWNADAGYGDPPDDPFGASPTYGDRSYSIYTSVGFWHELRPIMQIDMTLWQKIAWELGDPIVPGDDVNNYIKLFDKRFGQARFKVIEKRLSPVKGISYKLMKVN